MRSPSLLCLLFAMCLAGLASARLTDVCKYQGSTSRSDCSGCCKQHQMKAVFTDASCLCQADDEEDPMVLELRQRYDRQAGEASRRCQHYLSAPSEQACSGCCERQLMALDGAQFAATKQCQCQYSVETQFKYAHQAFRTCSVLENPTYSDCFECCQQSFLDGDLVAFVKLRDEKGSAGEGPMKNCRCRVDLSDLDDVDDLDDSDELD